MEQQLYELCLKLIDYSKSANEKLSQFVSIAPAVNSERHLLNLATSFSGISTQRQLQSIQIMIPKALIDNAYEAHNRVVTEYHTQVKSLVAPFSDDTIKEIMPEFASYVLKLETATAWINGRAINFTTDPAFLSSFIRDGHNFIEYASSVEDELTSIYNLIKGNLAILKRAEKTRRINKIFFNKWAYAAYLFLCLLAALFGGDDFYEFFFPKKVESIEMKQRPPSAPPVAIPMPTSKKLKHENQTGPQ
jgi:hypothetical protein